MALCLATLLLSCQVPYVITQGAGQSALLLNAKPLATIIHDETDPQRAQAWALAWAAREFARTELHLNVEHQYERGVVLDRPQLASIVSAAKPFALEPYTWWFPLVGEVPYKGFFDPEHAQREAQRLSALGYDVKLRSVASYSLLGYLPDPLVSPMIEADPERIVELVIHELAHATLYVPGHSRFNEGLATFIGRRGRQAFIRSRLGKNPAALVQAQRRDADADRYREAVSALARELRIYYRQARVTKAGKNAIFRRHQRQYYNQARHFYTLHYRSARLPQNNAELLMQQIYELDAQLYARAFAAAGEDWKIFMQLLRKAAQSPKPNLALARLTAHSLAQRPGSLLANQEALPAQGITP